MSIIETRSLTKYYGKTRGVLDLNLSVEKGEVFGFLGPNGAGKTTTLRILLGFLRPTSGEALVFGMDTFHRAVEIHRRVGNLPGELALYPKLTGVEIVRYLGNLRGGVDWRFVETLAGRLNLDLNRRIGQYSHGNKQKIGLVQAFMHRPDLLILDEPTTGLDPLIQQNFYTLIDEARANGQTILISSHILPEVERLCDRVAIIREGRLVAIETVSALKAKALRRLEIVFGERVSVDKFENLPGVQDLELIDDRLRFTVVGSLDAVVKAAAAYTVNNVISEEPNLEEIFFAYYGVDEEAVDA